MYKTLILISLFLQSLLHSQVSPEDIRRFLEQDCADKIASSTAKSTYINLKAEKKKEEIHQRTDAPIKLYGALQLTSGVSGIIGAAITLLGTFMNNSASDKMIFAGIGLTWSGLSYGGFVWCNKNREKLVAAQQNEIDLVDLKVENQTQKLENLKLLKDTLQRTAGPS